MAEKQEVVEASDQDDRWSIEPFDGVEVDVVRHGEHAMVTVGELPSLYRLYTMELMANQGWSFKAATGQGALEHWVFSKPRAPVRNVHINLGK